jgi:hypothetical protein
MNYSEEEYLEQLQAKLAKCEKALEFYADAGWYNSAGARDVELINVTTGKTSYTIDKGEHARACLEDLRKP